MPLDEDIAGGYGSNIGRSGGNGSFGREGGNPYTSGNLIPVAQPPNKFMQAGDIQSQAYLEGAGVESDFLRQAIESLRGYGGFDPYMQAGHGALAGLQEGSTVGGFGNRLNEIIGGDAFGGVVDERMRSLQAGLASSGLRRSGHAMNEAAAIPLDVAMGIEGMLSGRQSGLAGLGLNAAQSQGGLEQMIAQLMGGRGAVEAGGITGAAEAEASGIIGELAYQDKRKQDSNKNRNDLLGLGLKALTSGLFSDPRLKKNIKKEGKIGPLDLISWEWIDKAKDTIVSKSNTFGFMSTQVKEHYPECVGEFGGFDIVDYGQLIGRLKCL